jgi:hypothetical protein
VAAGTLDAGAVTSGAVTAGAVAAGAISACNSRICLCPCCRSGFCCGCCFSGFCYSGFYFYTVAAVARSSCASRLACPSKFPSQKLDRLSLTPLPNSPVVCTF